MRINFADVPKRCLKVFRLVPRSLLLVMKFEFPVVPLPLLFSWFAFCFYVQAALYTWLPISACQAQGQEKAVEPYISYANQLEPLIPFGKQSFYLQPWRGYLETIPATQFLAGLGINYNLPNNSDDESAIKLLSDSGFHSIRLEIGWGNIPWSEDRIIIEERIRRILTACKRHGVKPLILLNSNHGVPGPSKTSLCVVIHSAQKGDRTLKLNNTEGLVEGYSGLSNVSHQYLMAGYIFKRIDHANNVVELSRPLPGLIAAGTSVSIDTLKYLPLYPLGTTEFEATANGWIKYAMMVCNLVRECGITAFEVEIWNELTFGSDFLDINHYYDPKLFAIKADFLHPGGSAWELARRTASAIKDKYPNVKVIWGFSNTTFYHTAINLLPSNIDGQSYHPYGGGKQISPTDFPNKGRESWFIEGYIPNKLTKCMPEGWAHLGIQTEHLIRLVNPQARATNLPPGAHDFEHYMTENGSSPAEAGIKDSAEFQSYKAKCLLRSLMFWLNKGIAKVFVYSAYENLDTGFGLMKAAPLPLLQNHWPAPGDPGQPTEEQLESPALSALKNVVSKFAGAEPVEHVRALDVHVTCLGHPPLVFEGNNKHPSLSTAEMFTFLPFQLNSHKFVCGVYVMSYDITSPLAAMEFKIRLNNIDGTHAVLSYYDPLTGVEVGVKEVVQRDHSSITLRLEATAVPRLLVLEEK